MSLALESSVLQAADALLTRQPILSQPFFQQLHTVDRSTFVQTQQQFFYAVRYFSQAMAALMARMPDSASRQVLMHNLAEEHGYDDADFQPSMAHDKTFLQFLKTLGAEPAPQGPGVRAFNLALYGACATEPPPLAFAALGIIEYTFADISALIGKAVVDRGWIAQQDLVHYSLHAEIDKRHAAEFFDLLKPSTEVQEGLEFGLHIFGQLYASL